MSFKLSTYGLDNNMLVLVRWWADKNVGQKDARTKALVHPTPAMGYANSPPNKAQHVSWYII